MGSLGGFACLLQMDRWAVLYGLDGVGADATRADMELKGEIFHLHYADFNDQPSISTASARIIFTDGRDESFGVHDNPWNTDRHIGALYVIDNRYERRPKEQFSAEINLILPMCAFGNIALMDGRRIMLNTIHDVVPEPPDSQSQHLFAYVQRVYFETVDFRRQNKRR